MRPKTIATIQIERDSTTIIYSLCPSDLKINYKVFLVDEEIRKYHV